MGVLEEYMFSDTKSNLLCHQVKGKYFGDTPYLDIDPYLGMFERVHKFFKDTKDEDATDALRTAFYLKVGTTVTPQELEEGSDNWKKQTLVNMLKDWGWDSEKVDRLNGYSNWQMMHKVDLGNRINKILMACYKNISEKNKTLDPSESVITEKDTHLLGRKLFSFYRTAPNKVDNLGALVDGKTAETELSFFYDKKSLEKKAAWYLIRGNTRANDLKEFDPENIIKKSSTLPFLTAFTVFNNLYNNKTKVLLLDEGNSIKETDLQSLLEQLRKFLASVNIAALDNEDLLADAKVNQLFLLIDFGSPPPPEITMGNINECKNNDDLNKFISKRIERVKSMTTTYLTTWGELFSKTYSGINCFARGIAELSTQLTPEKVEKADFLNVYIPSGRNEVIKIDWLNNYATRSMLIKSKAQSNKIAS